MLILHHNARQAQILSHSLRGSLGLFGMLWQKYHKLCSSNHRHLFLTVLEARKSKITAPLNLLFGKSLLPNSKATISSLCLQATEGPISSLGLFWRALISFKRAPSSGPNHLPKAPPPNTITLGLGFTMWMWGMWTNIQSMAETESPDLPVLVELEQLTKTCCGLVLSSMRWRNYPLHSTAMKNTGCHMCGQLVNEQDPIWLEQLGKTWQRDAPNRVLKRSRISIRKKKGNNVAGNDHDSSKDNTRARGELD